MKALEIISTAFVLTAAISLDAFASGFAYGTTGRKLPIINVFVINVICSIFLSLALLLGTCIHEILVAQTAKLISIFMLAGLGLFKISQFLLNRKSKMITSKAHVISWTETLILALGLSLDGIAVGLGTAIDNITFIFCAAIIGFSLITDMLFFVLGELVGRKLMKKSTLHLSWLSGLILIIIASLKII